MIQLKKLLNEDKNIKNPDDVYSEAKEKVKEYKNLRKEIDNLEIEYNDLIKNITKTDVDGVFEAAKTLYTKIGKVTRRGDQVRVTFSSSAKKVRELNPFKREIEDKLGKPSMLVVTGGGVNSYGEYGHVIFTLSKTYIKSAHKFRSWSTLGLNR